MKQKKFIRSLALAIAFSPLAVMAGSLENFLGAVLKEVSKNSQKQGVCGGDLQSTAADKKLNAIGVQETPTIEAFCAKLRTDASPNEVQCFDDCEARYQDKFAQEKSRVEQMLREDKEKNDRYLVKQQEEYEQRVRENKKASDRELARLQVEDRKAAQEKLQAEQQAAARKADLRAGRVKPQNLGEIAIVYNAEIGAELASAPKIRPDGNLYALPGKIVIDKGETPEFLAQLTLGERNDAMYRMLGQGNQINNRYFYIKIPKALQKYYFDKAKIGSGFDVVGKYIANAKYTTLSGSEKSAPVFEAVYFVMWGN